jgi:Icc protein
VLVQLSDPHIGANWVDDESVARLASAVEVIRELNPHPDGVLVSGDLADAAADAQYEQVQALLSPLDVPIHVVVGNHDAREALTRHFGAPMTDGYVQYSVDVGPLRLVVLDTQVPGKDSGHLDAERMAWLERELAAAPDRPTLVAMHHPPISIGIEAIDRIGLPAADRNALCRVIDRHPQVQRLVGGHIHRAVAGELGGRTVVVAPSTYAELKPDFHADRLEMSAGRAGFVVHELVDGGLASHVQPVSP